MTKRGKYMGNSTNSFPQVKREKRVVHYIDAYNPSKSNWMRYVNCARNEEEQNLVAFQYKGEIYYRTTHDIMPGVELFVWYGDDYGKELGIDVPSYHKANKRGAKKESSTVVTSTKDKKGQIDDDFKVTEPQNPKSHCMQTQLTLQTQKIGKKVLKVVNTLTSSMTSRKQFETRNETADKQWQTEEEIRESKEYVESGIIKENGTVASSIIRGEEESGKPIRVSRLADGQEKKADITKSSNPIEGLQSLRSFRFFRERRRDFDNMGENEKKVVSNHLNGLAEKEKNPNGFHCNECDRVFATRRLIIEHMKVHFDSDAAGEVCKMTLNKNDRLERQNHFRHQRNALQQSTTVSNVNENGNLTDFNENDESSEQRGFQVISQEEVQNGVHGGKGYNSLGKHGITLYSGNSKGTVTDDNVQEDKKGSNKDCNKCTIKLINEVHSSENEHMETHSDVLHTCHICHKGFAQMNCLKAHVLSVHLRQNKLSRQTLDKTFSQESVPEGRKNDHEKFEPHACSHRGKEFADVSILREHVLASSHKQESRHLPSESSGEISGAGGSPPRGGIETGEGTLLHGATDETFTSSAVVHAGKGQYRCRAISVESDLRRHVVGHAGKGPHKCSVCSRAFSRAGDLRRHVVLHTGEGPHKCSICSKAFSVECDLRRHMVVHTGERPHRCSICSKAFTQAGHLRSHMVVHTGERPHKCSICSKDFSVEINLRRHMVVHTGESPHKCSICSKAFSVEINLRRHMVVHTGERPHKCSVCSKAFSDASNLRKHMVVHTGESPHKCSICSKAFSVECNLRRHMVVHTGERPHKCSICSKAFSRAGEYRRHMTVHTGQGSFRCYHCPYATAYKSSLRQHILRLHVTDNEE